MAGSFKVLLNNEAADDDFYTQMTSLEVEDNIDLPAAFQLHLPVSRSSDGDLTFVNDDAFQPFTSFAVVVSVEGQDAECIFDGFVLSQKLHVETGTTNSTLQVWGQDASVLMNLEEKVKEWVDTTEGAAANAIFDDYGIQAAPENLEDDSPSHPESGHTLMQRGTDIQFLRRLAKRSGKFVRVTCADQPGDRTGFFAKPALDASPALTLLLNDPESWNVNSLDIEWEVMRPSAVRARQTLFNDPSPDGAIGDASDSGLPALGDRDLATFAGQPVTVLLAAPVDDAGELAQRSRAVLRDAGWFVHCEGEADVARLNQVIRAGSIVEIAGIGSVHSGKYLVWSVHHTITQDSHKMRFVLARNAVGPTHSGGGILGGLQ
jgi:phage protein D